METKKGRKIRVVDTTMRDGSHSISHQYTVEQIRAIARGLNEAGVGNSLAAAEANADIIDGSMRGMGAGAGNAMLEAIVAGLDKLGYETGIDLFKLMDVGENLVKPIMPGPQEINNASLTLGYAGVYSSFCCIASGRRKSSVWTSGKFWWNWASGERWVARKTGSSMSPPIWQRSEK